MVCGQASGPPPGAEINKISGEDIDLYKPIRLSIGTLASITATDSLQNIG